MNNRRKFLMQSGVVAAGVMTLKPFDSFGSITNGLFETNSNTLTILHTHELNSEVQGLAASVNKKVSNCLLLDTAAAPQSKAYRILHKGNISIGVIEAGESMHENAAILKKQKNCTVVICLSSCNGKDAVKDDNAIAANSTDIDIILGTCSMEPDSQLRIALNKNQEEVIIHHVNSGLKGLGRLDLGFDASLGKNHIRFESINA